MCLSSAEWPAALQPGAMGSAFSTSTSEEEQGWGEVQARVGDNTPSLHGSQDEDLFVPVKNFSGETIGWRERTESDKLRRKM